MENHPITQLYMRIASLETEVSYLKDQLARSNDGGTHLINLIAGQRIQNSLSPQQAAIQASEHQLRQQLTDLLEENIALRSQLATDLKRDSELLQTKVDAAFQRNVALQRELEPFLNAARIGREQEKREQTDGPGDLGSWARGDAFYRNNPGRDSLYDAPESVHRWVTTCAWPSSVEDCKRGPAQAGAVLSPKNPAKQASGSNDAAGSDEAGFSTSSAGEKKSEKSAAPIRIEATNGETFFVHPAPSLTSTEDANKHLLRREKRSLKKPDFPAYEHNRLAGVATFIEDFGQEQYAEYWQEYACEHRDHSARQWREYYESEVRPAYLEKAAEEKQAVEQGSDKSGVRKDSVLPSPKGVKPSTELEPFPLIDMAIIEEEMAQMEEQAKAFAASLKQPEPAAAPSFVRYSIQQLRDCRPFAHSVSKAGKRIAPDDPEFSTFLELSNVREVPMTAYTSADIKTVEIKSSSTSSPKCKHIPPPNTLRIKLTDDS